MGMELGETALEVTSTVPSPAKLDISGLNTLLVPVLEVRGMSKSTSTSVSTSGTCHVGRSSLMWST